MKKDIAALSIYKEKTRVSNETNMTSFVILSKDGAEKLYCAYCGKHIQNHLTKDGKLILKCNCEKAKREQQQIKKLKDLKEKIQKMTEEYNQIEEERQLDVWKSSTPYIIENSKENDKKLAETLDTFVKNN